MLSAAPPAPLLVDLQPGSDSGLYDDDDLTNVATPTVDITAAGVDDTINVYRAGVLLGQATQVSGTLYAYNFAPGVLLEGGNSITARSFDGVEESVDSLPLVITLDTIGPRITDGTPDAPVNLRTETLDSVSVTFSEAIDYDPGGGTLTVADTTITGPEGEVTPTSIASLGGDQYEIAFAAQTRRGTYAVSVGPDVADLAGNPMDQDQDGQPGGKDPCTNYQPTNLGVCNMKIERNGRSGTITSNQESGSQVFPYSDVSTVGGKMGFEEAQDKCLAVERAAELAAMKAA